MQSLHSLSGARLREVEDIWRVVDVTRVSPYEPYRTCAAASAVPLPFCLCRREDKH